VWGRYCACEILIANPFDWIYVACLEYFIFFSIDSSEARKQYDEYCLLIWPNGSKLGRKHPWKVLYKYCLFSTDLLTKGRHRPFLFLIGWFLKKSFPLKPLSQVNWNLVGSIYGRFSIKIAHFVPIHCMTNMSATGHSCLWLADLKKQSSPLKPLGQMNRNLVGSIYGRSSIKIANFVPIR
jgi:hypothetical protein